jgi:hypothetical protein
VAGGGVVADKLDLGILVEVGVGVELARDEVVEVARARGKDKRQAVDVGVDETRGGTMGRRGRRVGGWDGEVLAQDKGEVEEQLVVGGQAQQEGRRAVGVGQGLGVLDKVDEGVVAGLAPGGIAGGGEGVGRDVEQRAVAGVGDTEGGDRDCRARVGELAEQSRASWDEATAYIESGRADRGRLHRQPCC